MNQSFVKSFFNTVTRVRKHKNTNTLLGLLLLASSGAFAQLDIITPQSGCLEVKYSLLKQGKQEQLFEKSFNQQGKLLSEKNTFSDKNIGNYTEEFTYEYDVRGNNNKIVYSQNNVIKKVTQKDYGITGKLTQEVTSAGLSSFGSIKKSLFSESGTEQIFFDKDGITETIREKTGFDQNGQIITKEVVSAGGKVAFSDKYTYAAPGKVSRWVHFDAAANVVIITNYEYDVANNLTKETTTRNDVLYAETINTYNANGKLEKKTRLNGAKQVDYYFTYEYNEKGMLVKENYFYNNEILSVQTFAYDDKGNKVKEVYASSNGKFTTVKEWEYLCK